MFVSVPVTRAQRRAAPAVTKCRHLGRRLFCSGFYPPRTCGFRAAKWLRHLQASHLPSKKEEEEERRKLGQPLFLRKTGAFVEASLSRLLFPPRQGSCPRLRGSFPNQDFLTSNFTSSLLSASGLRTRGPIGPAVAPPGQYSRRPRERSATGRPQDPGGRGKTTLPSAPKPRHHCNTTCV